MTILSASKINSSFVTVQCDLCDLPLIITNLEPVIHKLGWQLQSRGASCDACPACLEARDGRAPFTRRRDGFEQHSSDGRLPDLVVVGAAKAGTTSMHFYLDAHPEIFMARHKELRFFSDPDCSEWVTTYKQQFASNAKIVGESSTMYSRSPAVPGAASRMFLHVPEARLIYLVRDPVERAIASYVEERFHGLEPRTVEEAFAELEDPYNPYLAASRYAEQLSEYTRHFSRDQILVLCLTSLAQRPHATMRRVFEFLEVDSKVSIDTNRVWNARADKLEYAPAAARLRRSTVGRLVRRLPPVMRTALMRPVRQALTRPIDGTVPSPELRARIAEALASDMAAFRALGGAAHVG